MNCIYSVIHYTVLATFSVKCTVDLLLFILLCLLFVIITLNLFLQKCCSKFLLIKIIIDAKATGRHCCRRISGLFPVKMCMMLSGSSRLSPKFRAMCEVSCAQDLTKNYDFIYKTKLIESNRA